MRPDELSGALAARGVTPGPTHRAPPRRACLRHAELRRVVPAMLCLRPSLMPQVCSPLFGMIRRWVLEGELEDDSGTGEFFVVQQKGAAPRGPGRLRVHANLSSAMQQEGGTSTRRSTGDIM